MPVVKYFAVIGSPLLFLLLVSDTSLIDDESHPRFDGSLYVSALYAPRLEEAQTRSFASPAMSRLPFGSGKCLPCSPPTSGGATSGIYDKRWPAAEPAGTPDGNHFVTSSHSKRWIMQTFRKRFRASAVIFRFINFASFTMRTIP